jgi:hypothetical protein
MPILHKKVSDTNGAKMISGGGRWETAGTTGLTRCSKRKREKETVTVAVLRPALENPNGHRKAPYRAARVAPDDTELSLSGCIT